MYNTYYRSCKATKGENVSFESLLTRIKNGDFKSEVEKLRSLKTKEEKQKFKSNMAAFTVFGTCNGPHKNECFDTHNGVIGLDYDNCVDAKSLKKLLINIDSTIAAFISPSGNGVKAFVKTDTTIENHDLAFQQVKSYYDDTVQVASDESVKELARLCIMSYDPELYFNQSATTLQIEELKGSIEELRTKEINLDALFRYSTLGFSEGNRHKKMVSCAGTANRLGIAKEDVISYFSTLTDNTLSINEVETTINDIYTRYNHQNNTHSYTDCLVETNNFFSTSTWFNKRGKVVYENLLNDLGKKIVIIPETERVFAKSNTGSPIFDEGSMNMSYDDFFFFMADKNVKLVDSTYKKLLNSDKIDKINPLNIFYLLLSEQKWDGIDRFTPMVNAMNLEGDLDFNTKMIRKYFGNVYAFGLRGIDPKMPKKIYSRVAMILSSQKRGTGKTSFFRRFFLDGFIKENTGLSDLEVYSEFQELERDDNANLYNTIASKLFLNFDDIQDLIINSGGFLRSIISSESFTHRRKYATNSKNYDRRAGFGGSTNLTEIVNDKDENRYMIFNVIDEMNFEALNEIDCLQLWLQVRQLLIEDFTSMVFNNGDLDTIKKMSLDYLYASRTDDILSEFFEYNENPEYRLTFGVINEILYRNGRRVTQKELGNALKKFAPAGKEIKKKSNGTYYYLVSVKVDVIGVHGYTVPNSLYDHYKDKGTPF